MNVFIYACEQNDLEMVQSMYPIVRPLLNVLDKGLQAAFRCNSRDVYTYLIDTTPTEIKLWNYYPAACEGGHMETILHTARSFPVQDEYKSNSYEGRAMVRGACYLLANFDEDRMNQIMAEMGDDWFIKCPYELRHGALTQAVLTRYAVQGGVEAVDFYFNHWAPRGRFNTSNLLFLLSTDTPVGLDAIRHLKDLIEANGSVTSYHHAVMNVCSKTNKPWLTAMYLMEYLAIFGYDVLSRGIGFTIGECGSGEMWSIIYKTLSPDDQVKFIEESTSGACRAHDTEVFTVMRDAVSAIPEQKRTFESEVLKSKHQTVSFGCPSSILIDEMFPSVPNVGEVAYYGVYTGNDITPVLDWAYQLDPASVVNPSMLQAMRGTVHPNVITWFYEHDFEIRSSLEWHKTIAHSLQKHGVTEELVLLLNEKLPKQFWVNMMIVYATESDFSACERLIPLIPLDTFTETVSEIRSNLNEGPIHGHLRAFIDYAETLRED